MKKGIIALVLAGVLAGGAIAEDLELVPIMDPGTFAVNAGLGWGWGITLGGGAEFVFAGVKAFGVVPLTFGGAARAALSIGPLSGLYLDASGLATMHVSFKGLRSVGLPADVQDQLDRTDTYIGLGLGVGILGDRSADKRLYFSSLNGVNYFLTDNFALNVEYGYIGAWGGYGQLGVLLKI